MWPSRLLLCGICQNSPVAPSVQHPELERFLQPPATPSDYIDRHFSTHIVPAQARLGVSPHPAVLTAAPSENHIEEAAPGNHIEEAAPGNYIEEAAVAVHDTAAAAHTVMRTCTTQTAGLAAAAQTVIEQQHRSSHTTVAATASSAPSVAESAGDLCRSVYYGHLQEGREAVG